MNILQIALTVFVAVVPLDGRPEVGQTAVMGEGCTRDALFSMLEAQSTDGMEGYVRATRLFEKTGQCEFFPVPVFGSLTAVEYYGELEDGHNYIICINKACVIHVASAPPR